MNTCKMPSLGWFLHSLLIVTDVIKMAIINTCL